MVFSGVVNSLSLPLSNACHRGGGAYLFQTHSREERGGLNRDGGVFRSLFNLAKTMVSVLNKKQECQVRKLKYNG